MEDLRGKLREYKLSEQQRLRESILNKNRGLAVGTEHGNCSKEELVELAVALRSKSKTTWELLSKLKHIFLQDVENCRTFLQVSGALQGLVSALSGKNSKLQLNAAYCLCNLALSSEKASSQIIKAAGPYLNLYLRGMNIYLIEACAWTLGNTSSHSKQCAELLLSQGVFANLTRLLSHEDDIVTTAALYSMTLLVYHGINFIKEEQFLAILPPALKLYPQSVFLISLLSSQPSLQEPLISSKIYTTALTNIITSNIEDKSANIRIVANLITEPSGLVARHITSYSIELNKAIETIVNLKKPYLVKEILWLVGNLCATECGSVYDSAQLFNFLNNNYMFISSCLH